MTARLLVSACLCCAALAGCGVFPGLEDQEPAGSREIGADRELAAGPGAIVTPGKVMRRPESDIERLLAYFQQIRKLPAADLGREHEAARQAFLSSRSDFDRMRLAMLLSLPGSALADEARALELLDPIAKTPGGGLHGLATLLAANLQERRRLDASTQGLQQKLDALMLLERNMIERKR